MLELFLPSIPITYAFLPIQHEDQNQRLLLSLINGNVVESEG